MAFRSWQESQFSLGNLQDELNRLVERVWHAGVSTGPFDGQEWAPVVDLEEHADHYKLYAEIPGVDARSVDLSYLDRELTIRGEKVKPPLDEQTVRSLRHERRFGVFCRTVELPRSIEADRMTAVCHAGMLEVTIPKAESGRPKAVRVEVADE